MEYEVVRQSADYLLERTRYRPKIGVICGSGLALLGNVVQDADAFNYEDIPHFPTSKAPGHISRLLFGLLDGVEVVLMQGRFHLYDGYSAKLCTMPIRVMKLLGVDTLIATNAAGGLNPCLDKGDVMILNDHVNFPGFSGVSPLSGPNDERFGPRFFPLDDCYDAELKGMAWEAAKEVQIQQLVKEGCYAMQAGPNYETPAELRMLKMLGVDAVGMSTVLETITAKHCGIRVLAFSLITDICVTEVRSRRRTLVEVEDFQNEVSNAAKDREETLQKFVTAITKRVSKCHANGGGGVRDGCSAPGTVL